MHRNGLAVCYRTGNKNCANMNDATTDTGWFERLDALLAAEGFSLAQARPQLDRYVALVQDWNTRVSLVSAGDAVRLWESHLADSLSLAGVISRAVANGAAWLDIGPGAGLPAIPVRILCGPMPLTLCERSVKKSGVLRDLLDKLELSDVRLEVGEFPLVTPHPDQPVVITARAVEKPAVLHKALYKWMRPKDIFLCQAAEVTPIIKGGMFHVEPIEDAWTQAGLRRGKLWRVGRGGR